MGILEIRSSPLSRRSAEFKLGLGMLLSLWVIIVDGLPPLLLAMAVGIGMLAAARPNTNQLRFALVSLLLLVWGITVGQAIFYARFPRHALLVIVPPNSLLEDGIKIYAEGIIYGLIQSVRIVAVGLTGYAVCFSTSPDQIVRALSAFRVPFALAFMASTALRFLPTVAEEVQVVRRAAHLKGYRIRRSGVTKVLRTELALLRPVLVNSVRRSEAVAMALLSKGFRPHQKMRFPQSAKPTWGEYMLLLAFLTVVCTAAFIKVGAILYERGLATADWLRPITELARRFL